MKIRNQSKLTPRIASRRNFNTRKAVASPSPNQSNKQASDKHAIRPFRVNFPKAELTELRRRVKATRWPERNTDATQVVPLATVQALALYWENKGGFFTVKGVKVPVAVSVFPEEIYQAPRSWAKRAYPKLIYYNQLDKGGHFAAWEQPRLFAEEVCAGFRTLRGDKATALNR
jgi:pimeloyl-ACP methyl ester carboxylesterase